MCRTAQRSRAVLSGTHRHSYGAAANSLRPGWLPQLGVIVGLIFATTLWSCSSEDARPTPNSGTGNATSTAPQSLLLELFSWWTAPGEAEALQSLVDTHKVGFPLARVFNAAAASGPKAKEILARRLADNDPPDLFQENAHDLLAYIQGNPDKIEPLDSLFDELGLRKVVYPEILKDLTLNGHIYSMPVNLHRENGLIYNKRLFATNRLAPPTTLPEFLHACEVLKGAGVTPVVTSYQGWILRILFNSLTIAQMGSEKFHAFYTGKLPSDDPDFKASIDLLAEVLEKYTNQDAGEDGFAWTNAAQAVLNGDAAMFFHGDWAKGYLVQIGGKAGVDIDVSAAPGSSDMFLYGVDVFAMPRHAPNEAGARALLTTIASPMAQAAFNRVKGSSPPRTDVLAEQLDAIGQATMRDLKNAKYRMLVRSRPPWDVAIGVFATRRDKNELLKAYTDYPPGGH